MKLRQINAITLLVYFIFVFYAGMASAGVFYVKWDASGTGSGLSWTDAYTDIQSAVDAAVADDEIWVAAGTYAPALNPVVTMKAGVAIYGGFDDADVVRDDRDWDTNVTVLSGSSTNRCVIGANNARLDGFTVRDGNADQGGGMYNSGVTGLSVAHCIFTNDVAGSGAGISNDSSTISIAECLFTGITGTETGQVGLCVYNSDSTLSINNCTFSGNTSSFDQLSGLCMYNSDCHGIISNCVFKDNIMTTGYTAPGVVSGSGDETYSYCSFENNVLNNGYGCALDCVYGGNTIEHCTFLNNTITGDAYSYTGGAALRIAYEPSAMTVTDCQFINNNATGRGSAVYLESAAAVFKRCLFQGNGTVSGSTETLAVSYDTTLSLENCVFIGNGYEGGDAGAIKMNGSSNASVVNCTFAGNTGSAGELCIYTSPEGYTATIFNSILSSPGTYGPISHGGYPPVITYSNVVGGYAGEGNIDSNPLFANLLAGDVRLREGSPCIDAGTDSGAPTEDIAGNGRPQGVRTDMGAYEGFLPCGSILCTITPVGAVADGAQWSDDGGATWYDSGQTVNTILPGDNTILFKELENWKTPPSQNVSVSVGNVTEISAEYLIATGSLKVTLSPQGAVDNGARWSIDGGAHWYSSEYILTDIDIGSYTLTFSEISGFNRPEAQPVTITKDATTETSAEYVPQVHAIHVVIQPESIASGGAAWALDGAGAYSSDETVTVEPGEHTISFSEVAGYAGPSDRVVTVDVNATAPLEVTGVYYMRVYVDVNCPGEVHDGTSWATAFLSIQDGAYALSTTGGEVWVAEGMYVGTFFESVVTFYDNLRLFGGFVSGQTSRDARDLSEHPSIINGEGRMICVIGGDNAVLDGFVVMRGYSSYPNGAGLRVENADMTISQCTFKGNWLDSYNSFGGALYCTESVLTLTDCTFENNECGYCGGAVYLDAYTTATITGCLFRNNIAAMLGGGLMVGADCTASLSGCTFADNQAYIGAGGGLFINPNSNVTLETSVFVRNSAPNDQGGALENMYSTLQASRCLFSQNSANGGGAVCNYGTSTFTNSIFLNNTASNQASVFYNESGQTLQLMCCTLYGNSSTQSILTPGSATIVNSILWDTANVQVEGTGAIDITYSDIKGGFTGDGNRDAEPMFFSPAAGDMHLLGASPCLDAGTDSGAPTVDYGGAARPQGLGMDMGAFEGSVPVDSGGTLQITLEPQEVVDLGAQWAIDTSGLMSSGAVLGPISAGTVRVSVSPVWGWHTPLPDTLAITDGNLTAQTYVYKQITGALRVTIEPQGARDAGAQWSIDDGITWYDSSDSIGDLPIGDYTVLFSPVENWMEPGQEWVTIEEGAVTEITGTYEAIIHQVAVYLMPETEAISSAPWFLDGDGGHTGGNILDVEVGPHTVTFSDVPGLITPEPISFVMEQNATEVVRLTGWYRIILRVDADNLSGNEDGLTWPTAFSTVQAALDAAEETGAPELWIADGIYGSPETGSAVASVVNVPLRIYGGFIGNGDGGYETNPDQRDLAAHITTLDGNGVNRCVYSGGGGLFLDGLSLLNGHAECGGGVCLYEGGDLTIQNCTVANCIATGDGGGVYADEFDSLTLVNSTFDYNYNSDVPTETYGEGAGVYVGDFYTGFISNCNFTDNTTSYEGWGGGLCAEYYDSLTITDSAFTGNNGNEIEGIGMASYNFISLALSGCSFAQNAAATYAWGTAMAIYYGDNLLVENCSFTDNVCTAKNDEGSLTIENIETANVTRCFFQHNSNEEGGALFVAESDAAIENCIFHENNAVLGGALYVSYGVATVKNSTFMSNTVSDKVTLPAGDAIYCKHADITLVNSILRGSAAQIATEGDSTVSVTYSDIQGDYDGEGNINVEPLFIGTEFTSPEDFQLAAGSLCIDAGTNVNAPADDYAGIERPQGLGVDMGAFEAIYATLTVNIEPLELLAMNPQWTIDGGSTWYNSGETLNNLPAGTYAIAFSTVEGWTTPESQELVISTQDNFVRTGTYALIGTEGEVEGNPQEGEMEGTPLEGEVEGAPQEGEVEGVPHEGDVEGPYEGEFNPYHTADQDHNNLISLSELLRVIQFFNSNGYHCEAGTEDDYAPGPGNTNCTPHASDYMPQNWLIGLSELLRVIQFFNSGGYHDCSDITPPTEDGYCPGLG